jgi:hypothetical protein
MVKYHFITFATEEYLENAQEICKSALNKGMFDTVKIYTYDDIDEVFIFKNKHILSNKRGAGFWLWKPYIIQKHLLNIDEGDILCYCDSSYLFLYNIRNISDNWLKNKNICVPHNKPNEQSWFERNYTKLDTLILMNVNKNLYESYRSTYQAWAGFILLRKGLNSMRFIGEWLTYSQDNRIISDSKSVFGPEDKLFIDNRHDQSILSILIKKWGIPMNEIDKYFLYNKRAPL